MKLFSLIFFLSAPIYAQTSWEKPWYQTDQIKNLKIKVHFEKNSLQIHPVYFYHLDLMGKALHHLGDHKVVIVGDRENGVARYREDKIKKYLQQRFRISKEKFCFVQQANQSPKDFYVLLGPDLNSAQKSPPPVVGVENKIEDLRQPAKEEEVFVAPEEQKLSLPSHYTYYLAMGGESLKIYETYSSLSLGFGGTYKINSTFSFAGDFSQSFYDAEGLSSELNYGLGFDSQFERLFLKSRIYYQKNNTQITVMDDIETYFDYGLRQTLGVKLYKSLNFQANLSFFAGFSFANNFEFLDSAHVLTYSSELEVRIKNIIKGRDLGLLLFQRTRKISGSEAYRRRDEVKGVKLRLYL